ncbi:hypothetical protein ACFT5B_04265 [Luteimicrobium sp. NPDC057192]|uniref:hypothetical protein n=1 Tax=Luteimicrobium sp. NPDC057192 TaxID=3346042 RepID=UPI0036422CCC
MNQPSSSSTPRRVLLYGHVNLNVLDGSAIWLLSMAESLSRTSFDVDVLLKAPVTGVLAQDLQRIEGVRWLSEPERTRRMPARQYDVGGASARIEQLVEREGYDVVICRGRAVCGALARSEVVGPRLWSYMTDVPQTAAEMTTEIQAELAATVGASRGVFAQTDEARDFLEFHVPEARGKTHLLPPMVPDSSFAEPRPVAGADGPLRLVYSGKFARRWYTREMCALPAQAAERGFDIEVTLIGDKFQNDPAVPDWVGGMRAAVTGSPGVTWLGGMSRDEAVARLSGFEIGLGWRDPEMDASHELSTKLLEYGAAGVAPIVNRNRIHEQLLGEDYPLFVDDGRILDTLAAVAVDRGLLDRASAAARRAAAHFAVGRASERLQSVFDVDLGVASAVGKNTVTRPSLPAHQFQLGIVEPSAGELLAAVAQLRVLREVCPEFTLRVLVRGGALRARRGAPDELAWSAALVTLFADDDLACSLAFDVDDHQETWMRKVGWVRARGLAGSWRPTSDESRARVPDRVVPLLEGGSDVIVPRDGVATCA